MASPSGLFYAYTKWTGNHSHARFLLTFASRSIADEWWRLVSMDPANSSIKRISLQFYCNAENDNGNRVPRTLRSGGCAAKLYEMVTVTLLTDEDQTRHLSVVPTLPYTDHVSGEKYFIRSVLQPNLYWYYNPETRRLMASFSKRSSFTIRIVHAAYRSPMIMIGSDTVIITTGHNDAIRITVDETGSVGAFPLAPAPEVSDQDGSQPIGGNLGGVINATEFLFSDFTKGFALGYPAAAEVGNEIPLIKSKVNGESWELVN